MIEPEKTNPETSAQNTASNLPGQMQPQINSLSPENPELREELKPELVTAESLAEGELPEPSDHVIREHVPGAFNPPKPDTETRPQATERGIKDNSGRYFDPQKHQHQNGEPITSDKGYFRPWGRAHRKAGLHLKAEGFGNRDEGNEESGGFFDRAKRFFGIEEKPRSQTDEVKAYEIREPAKEAEPGVPQFPNGGLIGLTQSSRETETSEGREAAANAAAQFVAMEEMIAVMVFSEEWQFLPDEKKGLVMAWTRAFEEKGVVETPWWVELGAAHAVILANRADKPKTREKLGKLKARFMKKVIDLRSARAPAVSERRKESE